MIKKLLFTALAGAMTLASTAGNGFGQRAALSLRVFDHGNFIVNLDGDKYHPPTTRKDFDNLTPGTHFLKVVRVDNVLGPYGEEIVRTVVFTGDIMLPPNRKVNARIGPAQNFKVLNMVLLNGNIGPPAHTCGPTCGPSCGQAPAAPTGCGPNCGPGCSHGGPVGYTMPTTVITTNNGSACGPATAFGMAPGHFSNLRLTISNTTFESDKLRIAKNAVSMNGVTSQQVLDIMILFTYESSKVEFAKFAFAHTVDRHNYYVVNNGFTFSSSINELNRFTNGPY